MFSVGYLFVSIQKENTKIRGHFVQSLDKKSVSDLLLHLTLKKFAPKACVMPFWHVIKNSKHSFSWYVTRDNVYHSSCTLSGGSHCFQPVRPPCTDQAAAWEADRWCSSRSTARWRTPSCLRTRCCHCFGLPGSNPGWWELDVLNIRRQKGNVNRSFPLRSFCHSSAKIISTCQITSGCPAH